PGGATGFIVRDYKGKNADQPFYCYDSALMRDRLALRKQLAQELGQWTERVRTDGVKVNVDVDARREGLKNLTLAELLELERLTRRGRAPAARQQPPEEVLALPQPTKAEDDVQKKISIEKSLRQLQSVNVSNEHSGAISAGATRAETVGKPTKAEDDVQN